MSAKKVFLFLSFHSGLLHFAGLRQVCGLVKTYVKTVMLM